MLGSKGSGLQRRLAQSRGEAVGDASYFDRDALLKELRPHAQERVREKFTAKELADRNSPEVRKKVRVVLLEVMEEHRKDLPKPALLSLADALIDDLLGYGPLEPYFSGPMAEKVTEIKVVCWDLIRVEIEGQEVIATDERGIPVKFRDEEHVRDVLDRMLAPTGRRIDLSSPRVSARLPDGSRLMAHIPPIAVEGTTMSIRRFKMDMTMDKLVENGALSEEISEFLEKCVRERFNIVVSGGTSSGKSTFLNTLASFIPDNESLITIEDPAELQLQHSNVRRLEARPPNIEGKGEITQRDLVADALRMAPRRIIVGECRRGEAFDMMQAMNTGHDGSLTTGHANSAEEMLNSRLPNMIQMADMGLPYEAIIRMIAGAVDLVVHLTKDRDGRRRVDHICETAGIKSPTEVGVNPIYLYENGSWVRTENKFLREDKFAR